MASDGYPFAGILYAGLMLTSDGPKVLEFNVRFGDPETQVILTRLNSDLLEIFWSIAEGKLNPSEVRWLEDATVCIVMAASGYPGPYEKGMPIRGIEKAASKSHTEVFQAGTSIKGKHPCKQWGTCTGSNQPGSKSSASHRTCL